MKIHKLSFAVIIGLFTIISFGQTIADNNIEARFQELLDQLVSTESSNISGVSMAVISPEIDLNWTGAAGYDSEEKNSKLNADQPFRVASITKTYVAAAILRLHEDGELNVNHPISEYISQKHIQLLKSDGYDPDLITIRHCLHHRSGLFDYAMGSQDYVQVALQDPDKKWTRTEQIEFAMTYGEPLGSPGNVYAYSDTGYVILGEIIERKTNMSLPQGLKRLLNFEELGLYSTWMEGLEAAPSGVGEVVHRYMGDLDATHWDNSVDLFGGGGLLSTSMEIAIFINALFNGHVFKSEDTLKLMLMDPGPVKRRLGSSDYRMGLWRIENNGTYGYTHNGFWNTVWVYLPEYNSTIVINYTAAGGGGLFNKTYALIKERSK